MNGANFWNGVDFEIDETCERCGCGADPDDPMMRVGEYRYHRTCYNVAVGQSGRCADCGKVGERTGHMTCQYPGNRSGGR